MFSKIIVGVDGTAQGTDAVALGATLANLSDAELVIAHCHAPGLSEGSAEILAAAAARSKREARLVSKPGDGAARGLSDLAAAEHADLIVIGASHRGRFEQIFVGDVTSSLIDAADCSVAIAPRGLGASDVQLDTIAVAVDEASTALAATRLGAELANAAGADIFKLVHVDKPPAPYAKPHTRPADGSTALEEALEPLGARNVTYELRVGPPASELIDLTEEVDLVLLAPDTRDKSRSRFVSRILAHTASAAVIICLPAK